MKEFIFSATAVFQISIFILTMYYLVLGFFGFHRKKEVKKYPPKKKFALIIAAHNEELVVANLIESLKHQNYPKELYDIFLIADNCTDSTAKIGREHGARVFERSNKEKRGKGFALEWMFDKIFKMDEKFDAIAIFDADNIASDNFLMEMNAKMCEGYKVVQGYIDSKNPSDSWITQSYSIAFWSANRLFQLARANIGLSNQIGGTGFVVDVDILKELGWGATCLTEDLEFSCKLVLNGEKVGWAHDAIVYDEKPLTLKQSWNQRKRWMQGFSDVASRYFMKLIKKAIKERSFVTFDCALYVVQPFVTLLLAVSMILTVAQNCTTGLNIFVINDLFNNTTWKIFSAVQFIITPYILIKDRKIGKPLFVLILFYSLNVFVFPEIIHEGSSIWFVSGVYLAYNLGFLLLTYLITGKENTLLFFRYLLYALYTLTWIPITVQGILNKNNKEWSHTKHVRQIGIYEV
ncbi:glycosyltransferase family 2 protein [Clostridium fallax]|uniref:Glycosyltransferase, catalytic subunit of cellulose synthase and poly-beta-1,6-N-acetylglucosamine synthase n=1 Tax=Clostridium fallax TaxID=1533 RepID=A0A1M4UP07_9CLOT|nr:glycosyltransferase family 2 protein [Clostridium fallax]SHE58424.1 hypothetical protein SAMN05443638_105120 [Clostridium fallax]SQB07666.1 glycosyl transferase family protein [Clostridium fallax]